MSGLLRILCFASLVISYGLETPPFAGLAAFGGVKIPLVRRHLYSEWWKLPQFANLPVSASLKIPPPASILAT